MDDTLVTGELVLLHSQDGVPILVRLLPGPQTIEGAGVLDVSELIGAIPGSAFSWLGKSFRVLRPSLADILGRLRRTAQIVTPKDAQYLLYLAGVGPGSRVAEAGSGSGALTTVLAHAVGPSGRVTSYDRRADFLEIARQNLARTVWEERVEFKLRDVAEKGFDVAGLDSVILDLAEPWAVLSSARVALRPGGRIATYTPTYNQLERTVRELRSLRFEEVRSLELLERELHVGEGGTRPEFDMLGHTGFLTGARRVE